MLGIFNVLSDVNACNYRGGGGLFKHCKRVCTECQLWEKNALLHPRVKLSQQRAGPDTQWGCSSAGYSIRPSRCRRRFDSPVWQGIFLPESTFSADSITCVHKPPCAIACINICVHVKDPVAHVRVRWNMETLKHPASTVGWVARLWHCWLSPGESNLNFPWEKSHWDNTVVMINQTNSATFLSYIDTPLLYSTCHPRLRNDQRAKGFSASSLAVWPEKGVVHTSAMRQSMWNLWVQGKR